MSRERPITIALDAMGGDHGPKVVVPAAVDFLRNDSEVRLILVGREEAIRHHLGDVDLGERLTIYPASEVVEMHDLPSKALRGKKDSSMRVGINLVHQGVADACVSAGNTGALMAIARFVLKMLPNIDRPAIITAIPSIEGHTWVLDLGANVDCTAENLFQFAVMGSELVASVARASRLSRGMDPGPSAERWQSAVKRVRISTKARACWLFRSTIRGPETSSAIPRPGSSSPLEPCESQYAASSLRMRPSSSPFSFGPSNGIGARLPRRRVARPFYRGRAAVLPRCRGAGNHRRRVLATRRPESMQRIFRARNLLRPVAIGYRGPFLSNRQEEPDHAAT